MHATSLHPLTVFAIWTITLTSVAWANVKSVTEAWAHASAHHPKKNLRFLASFLVHEQLAYAKRVPTLLCIALVTLGLAIVLPWA